MGLHPGGEVDHLTAGQGLAVVVHGREVHDGLAGGDADPDVDGPAAGEAVPGQDLLQP